LKLTHKELVTSCILLCHVRCIIIMSLIRVCWCVIDKVLHYMFEIVNQHQLAIYVNFNVCNSIKTNLNMITSVLDPTLKTNSMPYNENDSGWQRCWIWMCADMCISTDCVVIMMSFTNWNVQMISQCCNMLQIIITSCILWHGTSYKLVHVKQKYGCLPGHGSVYLHVFYGINIAIQAYQHMSKLVNCLHPIIAESWHQVCITHRRCTFTPGLSSQLFWLQMCRPNIISSWFYTFSFVQPYDGSFELKCAMENCILMVVR
jgi:hypothetical protein